MDTRIYAQSEIVERLQPVFHEYGIRSAVLFGSYAFNHATEESDVDIMVDSGLRGLKFVALLEAIREALNEKEVDLFDVTHIEKNSVIDREIKKTGVRIYG